MDKMDQDATWSKGVGLGPGDIVLDGNPALPTEMGAAAPSFRPMSIVAKRSPISATAELLLSVTPCWVHAMQPGMEMCGFDFRRS